MGWYGRRELLKGLSSQTIEGVLKDWTFLDKPTSQLRNSLREIHVIRLLGVQELLQIVVELELLKMSSLK